MYNQGQLKVANLLLKNKVFSFDKKYGMLSGFKFYFVMNDSVSLPPPIKVEGRLRRESRIVKLSLVVLDPCLRRDDKMIESYFMLL